MNKWWFFLPVIALCIQVWANQCLKNRIVELEADLAAETARSTALEESLKRASSAQLAIETQAQSCLEREAKGIVEAQIWYDIIENSQSRNLEDEERKGVPDDKTRRNLLDSLDMPL